MAMFSRFTERAQRVLVAAQKEAAQMGRNYVGTEHLLLGILTDPGSAAGALEGVTLDAARQEVIQMLGKGDDNSPIRTMVYTPRTKKVLEQSAKEARDLQHNYVGTEHLLLALIHEREGVAATILTKMGKNLQKKREEIKMRDFYLCPICTAKGRYDKKRKYDPQNLQVHHIESVRMAWTKRFENNNLITLCEKHHREAEEGKISKETLRTYIKHIPPGLKA